MAKKKSRNRHSDKSISALNSELESRLSPEMKKLVKRIDAIRESIGPVPFNVADLVREMRDNEG